MNGDGRRSSTHGDRSGYTSNAWSNVNARTPAAANNALGENPVSVNGPWKSAPGDPAGTAVDPDTCTGRKNPSSTTTCTGRPASTAATYSGAKYGLSHVDSRIASHSVSADGDNEPNG